MKRDYEATLGFRVAAPTPNPEHTHLRFSINFDANRFSGYYININQIKVGNGFESSMIMDVMCSGRKNFTPTFIEASRRNNKLADKLAAALKAVLPPIIEAYCAAYADNTDESRWAAWDVMYTRICSDVPAYLEGKYTAPDKAAEPAAPAPTKVQVPSDFKSFYSQFIDPKHKSLYLHGIYHDGDYLVASNGFTLIKARNPEPDPALNGKCIDPDGNIIDTKYPDYMRLVPQGNPYAIKVDVADLQAFVTDSIRKQFDLHTADPDENTDFTRIALTIPDGDVHFNAQVVKRFVHGMRRINADTIHLTSEFRAAVAWSPDGKELVLMMPLNKSAWQGGPNNIYTYDPAPVTPSSNPSSSNPQIDSDPIMAWFREAFRTATPIAKTA